MGTNSETEPRVEDEIKEMKEREKDWRMNLSEQSWKEDSWNIGKCLGVMALFFSQPFNKMVPIKAPPEGHTGTHRRFPTKQNLPQTVNLECGCKSQVCSRDAQDGSYLFILCQNPV